MSIYLTQTEIGMAVREKFGSGRRERTTLSPDRGMRFHQMALRLMSLIF